MPQIWCALHHHGIALKKALQKMLHKPNKSPLVLARTCVRARCDWCFSLGPSKEPAMHGPSGFHSVRSSPFRSPANRFLYEQRHHVGTGSWYRSRAIPVLSVLVLWLLGLLSSSQAQGSPPPTPMTSSGLHTQVTLSATPPTGMVQYDITGGTRPGGGTNLFHSFGDFNVPNNNIANFLNDSGLATSNILGRVTGGNISNIFGTIQTTGFGNANLFLLNPAGFLFGPNATVNVGGMVAFTTADYLRLADNARFNAMPNASADALLTALPVASFGFLGSNPGAITVQGSQLAVTEGTGISLVGGTITVQSARLAAPGGQINLASIASAGEVSAGDFMPASGMTRGSITLAQAALDVSANTAGTVRIRGGELVMAESTIAADTINVDVAATAVDINLTGNLSIDGPGSGIFTRTVGEGAGGNIFVRANLVTLQNGGTLSAETSGTGNAGNISIVADSVSLTNFSHVTTDTSGEGAGGTIHVSASDTITGIDSFISASTTSTGPHAGSGGQVTLTAPTINVAGGDISTLTLGSGNAGAIQIQAGTFRLSASDNSPGLVEATTSGPGPGGNISIHGVAGPGNRASDVILSDFSSVRSETLSRTGGMAGNIAVETVRLTLTDGSAITTASHLNSPGNAGNITLDASQSVLVSGSFVISNVLEGSTGHGGQITITTPNLTVNQGSFGTGGLISTSTGSSKNAGSVTINADDVTLTNGGRLTSNSFLDDPIYPPASGAAGTVVIQGFHGTGTQATSIVISGQDGSGAASGIFTNTEGSGAGGSMNLFANSVTLQNGGSLSAASSGTELSATGGTITVNAGQVNLTNGGLITASTTGTGVGGSINIGTGTFASNASSVSSTVAQAPGGNINIAASQSVTMTNGSHVSASSTSPRNAGNIMINAGQTFLATNSTVTTQANQASGGTITITTTPSGTVQLTNSTISASVLDGTGGGGSVNIDPQFVILQNSQILARAVQGPGGNISITTNLLLPDADSVISASSQFGVNGTVTIQSPNAPASGKIQPLGKSLLEATSLLNQRCASLAGGEFSSFTMAGRDSLPTEPGSWLASPLAFGSAGFSAGAVAEGGAQIRVIDPAQKTTVLSLRQIAPAGFLTQAFAVDWSAGCAS
jgi:filamentous hemagglutinin family protein